MFFCFLLLLFFSIYLVFGSRRRANNKPLSRRSPNSANQSANATHQGIIKMYAGTVADGMGYGALTRVYFASRHRRSHDVQF